MDDYPSPNKTGSKDFYFQCSMPGCIYQCRTHNLYAAHVEEIHECEDCCLYVEDKKEHACQTPGMRGGHVDRGKSLDLGLFKEYSRSHKGTLITYINVVDPPSKHIEDVFEQVQPSIWNIYNQLFQIYEGIFTYSSVKVIMERESEGEWKEMSTFFRSENHRIYNANEDIITTMMDSIQQKIAEFIMKGSGWRVKTIENVEVKVGDLQHFANARGHGYLKMPFLKRGHLNIKNKDENCFVYCICAALHMDEVEPGVELRSPNIWMKYVHLHDFSDVWNKDIDIEKDIDAFELKNSLTVNVFSHRNKKIMPVRRSKQKFDQVINLFLIEELRDGEKLYHYVLITNLDKFLANVNKRGRHFCQYCMREFKREEQQILHSARCQNEEAISEEIWPEDWKMEKFNRPEMTLPYPYILLYDFETYSCPLNKPRGASTILDIEYKPASFSLVIVRQGSTNSRIFTMEYYDGDRVMEKFFERVFYWGEQIINEIRRTNNKVCPSEEVLRRHRAATHCFLCKREFTAPTKPKPPAETWEEMFIEDCEMQKKKVIKTFHHNHHTGEYVSALCQPCNLKVKYKSELVCIAHNATGFDHHLLVQALDCPLFDSKNIHVVAKNSENYIQMTLKAKDKYLHPIYNSYLDEEQPPSWIDSTVRLRFIDSNKFLGTSLRVLTENLRQENSQYFSFVKEKFGMMIGQPDRIPTDEDLQFLLRKLDYPYGYLSSPEVLDHPVPPREYFNNDLTGEDITDEDYDTVLALCDRFNIKDFRALTKLYTCLDTVLLAVVWEHFRNQCFKIYGLDPTYVATISSFAWNACFYQTGACVEYIRDPDMLKMVQSGIRGGPCFATQKIVAANNETLPTGYDETMPRSYIVYFDVVSLYSHALCDKFPVGGYTWVDVKQLEKIDWLSEDVEQNNIGYILKVDLEYCHNIHDRTASLPLAPQKKVIKFEELSPYQQHQVVELGPLGKSFITHEKLISDVADKMEYVIHYDTLRFYLQQGLKLKKIHCGFKFEEKACFSKYILDNIERRKLVTSKADRDLLKLCNNSIYGRTLMSNKNLWDVKFCRTRVEALEFIASPFLIDFKILKPNLTMVMLQPETVDMDKIVQAGFTVLEHAKKIYYEGFHERLRNVFGDRITNLYNDTDSSVCLITDPDNTFYHDLAKYRNYFDWSKIPSDHEIFKIYPECCGLNESESGLWKIESINISEGIFLKAKQYSLQYFKGLNYFYEMKCKGMTKDSLKDVEHNDLKKVIVDKKVVHLPMKSIRSINHQLYKITVDKIAFHYLDVNRFYTDPNNINLSYPFSHHSLYNCKCLE